MSELYNLTMLKPGENGYDSTNIYSHTTIDHIGHATYLLRYFFDLEKVPVEPIRDGVLETWRVTLKTDNSLFCYLQYFESGKTTDDLSEAERLKRREALFNIADIVKEAWTDPSPSVKFNE